MSRHDQLVNAVYKLLVASGCKDAQGEPTVWRIGQGAGIKRVNPRTGNVSHPLGQTPGVWDVLAVLDPVRLPIDSPLWSQWREVHGYRTLLCAVWLEIKIGRDKLSPAQVAFQARMESAGQNCFVAHDTINGLTDFLGFKLGGQR